MSTTPAWSWSTRSTRASEAPTSARTPRCSPRGASTACGNIEYRAASGEHGTLRARALVNAAGPWVARVHDEAGADARQGARPSRQGQPHRRPARASAQARVHPAERRPAHRLRHSLSGRLLADRHDRHRGRGVRASAHQRRGGRLPVRDRWRVSRASGHACGYRVDVQRRSPALRRRRVGPLRGHARLRAQARGGARTGAAAVDLRRQDHDVPPPRRSGARRAGALLRRDASRMDTRRRAARRRHGVGYRRLRSRALVALSRNAGVAARGTRCIATERARRAYSARRAAQPTWERISATRCTPPRSTIACARNGLATARTCCGDAPNAAFISTRSSAKRSPRSCALACADGVSQPECCRSMPCLLLRSPRCLACSPTSTTR